MIPLNASLYLKSATDFILSSFLEKGLIGKNWLLFIVYNT